MIIIIALFLLSWLPIHLYRLVTTYYPLIQKYFSTSKAAAAAAADHTSSESLKSFLSDCKNSSDQLCYYNAINKAIADIKIVDMSATESYKILHNPYVFFVSYFMSMSSVCYNPIVYFWMHKKFRTEVKQILSHIFRLGFIIRTQTSKILTFSTMQTSTTSKIDMDLQSESIYKHQAIKKKKEKPGQKKQVILNCKNETVRSSFRNERPTKSSLVVKHEQQKNLKRTNSF